MTLSCFELGERMLGVSEARQAILALAPEPLPVQALPLAEALGAVLAGDAISPLDVPQSTNAAMDGIALAWPGAEQAPVRWRRVGWALAGRPVTRPLGAGECVVITTGAPLPPGADTVIMREQLVEEGETLVVASPERVRRGQHVRRAGEDIPRGATALPAGTRLGAAELGLLASLGLARVAVHRRPRVALFSTGDEVVAPGAALPPAAIYDANRFSLLGLVREHGGEVQDLGILPDDREVLAAALTAAAAEADLVITSGGVSVGEADHTRAALARVGEVGFWKVAMRPGRPLACGRLGARRVPFLGLPGNPVAAMVTFLQFAAPLLARLQGRGDGEPRRWIALAEQALPSRVGRVDFLRGVYRSEPDGRLWVAGTGAQGSGILSSMTTANCLIEIAAEREGVAPGEPVTIQPLLRF